MPIICPPDVKSWLIWKDPDVGKDWRQEEKGTTEDEMVRWFHWLNGHEFEQAPGVGDGQGGLACCSSWGHKEWDMTEQLNWTELNWELVCKPRSSDFQTGVLPTLTQKLGKQPAFYQCHSSLLPSLFNDSISFPLPFFASLVLALLQH